MTRATASFALAFRVFACALLAGCAAPGEPTARHPVVPAPVADLAGRQSGSEVVLTFALPNESTDHSSLNATPLVEIYRAELAPGATPDRKTLWRLDYEIPPERVDSYKKEDHIEFRDPLTTGELSHAGGFSLAYMVRTRVARSRTSDDSNFFIARVFPPPAAPQVLRVSITENALTLSWMESPEPSGASSGGYRVYRAEMESEQEAAAQDIAHAKLKSPMELVGSPSSTDFSDTQFEFGKTYLYAVRSQARFGSELVESADSMPVAVTPRDIFPPATPGDLQAAIIPATPQAPAYIELSWAISPEGDLAGYRVYRSDREDSPGELVNSEILPSPVFRDMSVGPGRRYFYRVSAIDRAGNESPKSAAVEVDVP